MKKVPNLNLATTNGRRWSHPRKGLPVSRGSIIETVLFILIVGTIITVLTGCYQKIDGYEINKAKKLCEDHNGVFYITESFGSLTQVKCGNGKLFTVKEID